MTFKFPDNKLDFTAANGITYSWDGLKWVVKRFNSTDEDFVTNDAFTSDQQRQDDALVNYVLTDVFTSDQTRQDTYTANTYVTNDAFTSDQQRQDEEQAVQNNQINLLETQIQLLAQAQAIGKWKYERNINGSSVRPPVIKTFYGTHTDGADTVLSQWSDLRLLMISTTDLNDTQYSFVNFEEGDKIEILASDGSSACYGTLTNNPAQPEYGNMIVAVERSNSGPIEDKEYIVSIYRPGAVSGDVDLETLDGRYLVKTGGNMTGHITSKTAGNNSTYAFRVSDSSDTAALDIWVPGGIGKEIKYVASNGTKHWFQNYNDSGNVQTTLKLGYQDYRLLGKTGVTYQGTDSHRFQGAVHIGRGDQTSQFKISPNSESPVVNIYTLNGGQMRFRTSHTTDEKDYNSHIILLPDENNPQTKIYNVVEAGAGSAVPKSYVDEKVAGAGGGVPVGSIMIWMNSSAPDGWFKLQGGSFNVDTYPLLHAYLENTEGYTSGTLPNWSGRYPGEYGNHITHGLGTKVDYQTARPKTPFTTDNPGNHTHRYGHDAYGGGATNSAHDARNTSQKYETTANGAHTHTITGGGDSTTRPRTVVVHYIIKHD